MVLRGAWRQTLIHRAGNPPVEAQRREGRKAAGMEMKERSTTHLRRDEGRTIRAPDGPVTYKVTAGQTGGAYSLFEQSVSPGEGAASHIHHREDECFYVVEGEIEFRLDGEAFAAGSGSLVYVPRGTVHAFTNTGTVPARVLDLLTPGGTRERLLEEIGEGGKFEDLHSIYTRYGIEMLPPGG
jgi:mannose-6-phosphate isomerase-like protein (cupin superfamily)